MSDSSEFTDQELRLVVVGTSAGGLEALLKFLPHLPDDFPAAILVVQHLPAGANMPVIMRALQRQTQLPCQIAQHNQLIEPGYIYLPPADHHLLVNGRQIQLSRGARENRWRPGIDPLFRSAAVAFGPAVTGVVLTGLLDDGTAGMHAIKRCGGTTVVQSPADAQYPDMPQHVLNNVPVDQAVPLANLGPLLTKLVQQPLPPKTEIPYEIKLEAEIAGRVVATAEEMAELGPQSSFSCPECGGSLAEMKNDPNPRFRCFTGHTFSAHTFLHNKAEEMEEALWASVRMLEERRNMYKLMARREQERGNQPMATAGQFEEKARQAERYANNLREAMLQLKGGLENTGQVA